VILTIDAPAGDWGAGSSLGLIKPRDKTPPVRLLNRALRIDDIGPQIE
jgi:hypothetical protein